MTSNGAPATPSLRLAAADRPGAFLTFDATADDWANYDPATHDYVTKNWRDSFLAQTGYRAGSLPFEFVRRLAWRLGSRDGLFRGCVLRFGENDLDRSGYHLEAAVNEIPDFLDSGAYWQPCGKYTVYYPRSIDDLVPLLNENDNVAIIYLGLSKAAGFIVRLDEDDEWYLASADPAVVDAVLSLAEYESSRDA